MIAACCVFPSAACILAWTGTTSAGQKGDCDGRRTGPRYLPEHATDILCLGDAYVLALYTHRLHELNILNISSIFLRSFAMSDFTRLNRTQVKQCAMCAVEKITEDKASDHAEMGDVSPLYRSVHLAC